MGINYIPKSVHTGFIIWPLMWLSLTFSVSTFIVSHVPGTLMIVSGATQFIKPWSLKVLTLELDLFHCYIRNTELKNYSV